MEECFLRFFSETIDRPDVSLGTSLTELSMDELEQFEQFLRHSFKLDRAELKGTVFDVLELIGHLDPVPIESRTPVMLPQEFLDSYNNPNGSCIFCQIISGKAPCLKVYESNLVLAFLDTSPISLGHVLVVPKRHFEKYHDLSVEYARSMGEALLVVSKAIGADSDYNILSNNGESAYQSVFHLHFHVIGRNGGGLKLGSWKQTHNCNLEKIAAKIRHAIGDDEGS